MIDDSLGFLGFTMLLIGSVLLTILFGVFLTTYASFAQAMFILAFIGVVLTVGGGMLVWCFLIQ